MKLTMNLKESDVVSCNIEKKKLKTVYSFKYNNYDVLFNKYYHKEANERYSIKVNGKEYRIKFEDAYKIESFILKVKSEKIKTSKLVTTPNKKENNLIETEKDDIENWLNEDSFQRIILYMKPKEYVECPICGKNLTLEKCHYKDDYNSKRTVQLNPCKKCRIAYIKIPKYTVLPKWIWEKSDDNEEKAIAMDLIYKYGLPFKPHILELENGGGELYVTINGQCIYGHKIDLHKKVDLNIITEKGIVNKIIPINKCNRCGKWYVSFERILRLQKKGIPIVNITDCELVRYFDRMGVVKNRIKTNKIKNKDALNNIRKYSEMKDGIEKLGFGTDNRVVVHHRDNFCQIDAYKLVDVKALINVILPSGKIQEVECWVAYCKICGTFYIHDSVYKKILKMGVPQCQFVTPSQYNILNQETSFNNWNQESVLHSYGYNVSELAGLSDEQRQTILLSIIYNKELSIWEIMNHISFLIRFNENRPEFENALEKWKRDIEYLDDLDLEYVQKMKPTFIEIRKIIGR